MDLKDHEQAVDRAREMIATFESKGSKDMNAMDQPDESPE
jgi:hypothetical protein